MGEGERRSEWEKERDDLEQELRERRRISMCTGDEPEAHIRIDSRHSHVPMFSTTTLTGTSQLCPATTTFPEIPGRCWPPKPTFSGRFPDALQTRSKRLRQRFSRHLPLHEEECRADLCSCHNISLSVMTLFISNEVGCFFSGHGHRHT